MNTQYSTTSSPGWTDPESLTRALTKGRWHGTYGIACCPAHDDKNPSLTVRPHGRFGSTWKCQAGCDWHSVRQALLSLGLLEGGHHGLLLYPPVTSVERKRHEDPEWKRAQVEQIWTESREVRAGDPVDVYLTQTRSLQDLYEIPASIRYHEVLEFYEFDEAAGRSVMTGRHPAMVAAVRSVSGELVAVHRTYLTEDGRKLSAKKPGAKDKKILGSMAGAAIQLYEPTSSLLVAEGIETSLAAGFLFRLPCWAACSSSNMAILELPPGLEHLVIAADDDDAGRKAAEKLAVKARKNGITVQQVTPSNVPGMAGAGDWADVMETVRNAG